MDLKDIAIVQRFSDGGVIVSEGIASNNAYIVLSGKVQITKKVGKKTVIIGTLEKGQVFGEMGLISHTLRSASVIAVGNVTVGILDREMFEKILNNLPRDVRTLVAALVERLRMTTDMLTKIGVELDNARSQREN